MFTDFAMIKLIAIVGVILAGLLTVQPITQAHHDARKKAQVKTMLEAQAATAAEVRTIEDSLPKDLEMYDHPVRLGTNEWYYLSPKAEKRTFHECFKEIRGSRDLTIRHFDLKELPEDFYYYPGSDVVEKIISDLSLEDGSVVVLSPQPSTKKP
jgi:hypothetical protein